MRLSVLANNQSPHLLANPAIRESLKGLRQSSLVFVQSSKYAQGGVVQRSVQGEDPLQVCRSLPSTLPPSADIEPCSSSQSHLRASSLHVVGDIDSDLPSQSTGSSNDEPSTSRDHVPSLLLRQLSTGSGNGSLPSYLSTPESPFVKEGCNPEDSFNHSMFIVRGGADHFEPRASLSELKSENTLTRP